jgi:DNA-binding NarL/FixJ family response regulator
VAALRTRANPTAAGQCPAQHAGLALTNGTLSQATPLLRADSVVTRTNLQPTVPRRELVTLHAYLQTGSHKAAAHRLGISESTSRQRLSRLEARLGAINSAQAVWLLRAELEREAGPILGGDQADRHDP